MEIIKELKKTDFGKLIKLLKLNYQKYGWQIVLLAGFGFISGILEGIGINTLIPLFSFASKQGEYGDDLITQTLEKIFLFLHVPFSLKFLLIFIFILFTLRFVFLYLFYYIKIKISADYEMETRKELFQKMTESSWSHILKQKIGFLQTILTTHVNYGALTLENVANVIMFFSVLVVYVFVAVNISLVITLFAVLMGGLALLLSQPVFKYTSKIAKVASDTLEESSHFVNENVYGMKTIKAMSLEKRIIIVASDLFEKLRKQKIIIYLLKNASTVVIEMVALLFVCLVFVIFYKSNNFYLGAVVAIIYLIQKIFIQIKSLQSSLHAVSESIPYLESIQNYRQQTKVYGENDKGVNDFVFKDTLEFKNISFSYDKINKVLHDLSFMVKKGKMVGLVGPSGSGKTTVVDIFLRLFEPCEGGVFLDGEDIKNIKLSQWRSKIGYVSQDIFLINDTIANNIKFFNPGVGQKEMEEAAEMANIHDFIVSSPNGYDTQIGDRGLMLSGGQRQRIIIARILAGNPEILILDEATSALDNESEKIIHSVIESLKGKITVLIIAHRLTTVLNADEIFVLNNGEIIESGEPNVLLKQPSSYFYKMYNFNNQ